MTVGTRSSWFAVLASLVLATAACGGDGTEASAEEAVDQPSFPTDSTMAEIQERGEIIVGTKFDSVLFGQRNPTTSEVEGFDIEIAKAIAERIFGESNDNWEIEFVEAVTANRESLIQSGKVDMVLATYSITDERKQEVGFAGPYYISTQDIMVAADNTDIQGTDDLNGKRVCAIQGGTSYQRIQEEAPEAELVSFDTNTKCTEALLDGRVDAVATDKALILGFIAPQPDELKAVNDDTGRDPYGIGVPKEDEQFRTFINDVLEDMYESGEWQEIYEATIGEASDTVPEPPPVERY